MNEAVKLLAFLIGFVLVLGLACWSESAKITTMEAQVQEVARCRSLDGEYAGGKCFVNGEEK